MSDPLAAARAAERRRERAAPRYNRTGYTGRFHGSQSGADTPGPHSYHPVADPSHAASRLAHAAGSAGIVSHGGVATGMQPSIRSIQQFLHNQGYDIAVDGVMGPQTKAAIANWHQTSGLAGAHRHSAIIAFNQRSGQSPSPVFKSAHPGVHFGSGGGGGGAPADPPADPTTALIASLLATAGKVGTMIPASTADAEAGMQFDPQIHDLQVELTRLPRQNAQNLSDISNWYGQVGGAVKNAKAQDNASYDAGKSSLGDAVKSIVSSLGGSANAGTDSVGAAGADAVGTLGAIQAADSNFLSELGPLLASEAAGQKSQQQARATAQQQDLTQQVADLRGQRGQAQAAAMADILDKNNALAQTRFGNRAGLLQTLAALSTAGATQQNAALNAALKVKKLSAPRAGTFAAASPQQKSAVAKAITQALVDATTGKRKAGIANYSQAGQIAANIIRSNGWAATNPQVIQQILLPSLHLAGFYPPPGAFSVNGVG